MSNIKVISLLTKLQERLTRAVNESRQNWDKTRLEVGGLRDDVVAVKTLADDTVKVIVEREKVLDKREAQQTLRDQSNVQSLTNLRDSAQKAFTQVRNDVATLDDADKKLSGRLTEIERFQDDLVERAKHLVLTQAPALSMPSGHVWVNKKLTGVYDQMTELEARLQKLEQAGPVVNNSAVSVAWLMQAPVTYCGYDVRIKGSKLILESLDDIEVFYLPVESGDIVKVENRAYGLQISLKDGDQYCMVGGPTLKSMYLMCLVKS